VVHDVRSSGIVLAANIAIECETYNCDKSNAAAGGGVTATSGLLLRCISHDNTNALAQGFLSSSSATFLNCIADSNGTNGFTIASGATTVSALIGCDSYNNGGHGLEIASPTPLVLTVQNCNFIKNALWGIQSNATLRNGSLANCGFGAGTQANGSGTVNGT